MKQKIENAIRETLVIGNKESIHRAVDKISLIVEQEQALPQTHVGRSKALELLGSVLDNVGEIKSCGLMHKGCVAFRTTDGKAYKLSIQPQDQVVLD